LPFKFSRVDQIPDLVLIEPAVFEDKRGFFMETYSYKDFEKFGISEKFVQDNHSKSIKGVLRGLHFQIEPFAQSKLVRCIKGEIFDVAVDIRPGQKLSENGLALFCLRKTEGFYTSRRDLHMVLSCFLKLPRLNIKLIIFTPLNMKEG
jgi:dTDP-4-dehydrorhamnose 3,5-epimerase-like enzyme